MKSPAEKQAKYLKSAKRTIGFLRGSYPELGGAEQRGKFDELLSEVNQALGE